MWNKLELVESAGFVLNFLKKEWPNKSHLKDRRGGFLSVADRWTGSSIFTAKAGIVRLEKKAKYSAFAQEKVRRLWGHPDHILSSQSRNPAKDEWGGAVRGAMYLWGFSGLTEELDEIAMIGLALCKNDLTWDESEQLFRSHYPNLDAEFLRVFKIMAETDFEYGHIL